FTPGFIQIDACSLRTEASTGISERTPEVFATADRPTSVTGAGCGTPGKPSVRTALSCHPRSAGRSPSTDAASDNACWSLGIPSLTRRAPGLTGEGVASAVTGVRLSTGCPSWEGTKTVCEEE